jgi:hypothetical protein
VGPRAVLDTVVKRKIPSPRRRVSNPTTPIVQLVEKYSHKNNMYFYIYISLDLHHRVQNGFEAHPASYPVGTRDSFPGGKAAGT